MHTWRTRPNITKDGPLRHFFECKALVDENPFITWDAGIIPGKKIERLIHRPTGRNIITTLETCWMFVDGHITDTLRTFAAHEDCLRFGSFPTKEKVEAAFGIRLRGVSWDSVMTARFLDALCCETGLHPVTILEKLQELYLEDPAHAKTRQFAYLDEIVEAGREPPTPDLNLEEIRLIASTLAKKKTAKKKAAKKKTAKKKTAKKKTSKRRSTRKKAV
jgi:hypothetical protein